MRLAVIVSTTSPMEPLFERLVTYCRAKGYHDRVEVVVHHVNAVSKNDQKRLLEALARQDPQIIQVFPETLFDELLSDRRLVVGCPEQYLVSAIADSFRASSLVALARLRSFLLRAPLIWVDTAEAQRILWQKIASQGIPHVLPVQTESEFFQQLLKLYLRTTLGRAKNDNASESQTPRLAEGLWVSHEVARTSQTRGLRFPKLNEPPSKFVFGARVSRPALGHRYEPSSSAQSCFLARASWKCPSPEQP